MDVLGLEVDVDVIESEERVELGGAELVVRGNVCGGDGDDVPEGVNMVEVVEATAGTD